MSDSVRNKAGLYEIPIGDLRPWPGLNPRRAFDGTAVEELAASIREVGILEPLLVRPAIDPVEPQGRMWIVAGERRWRAAELAGLAELPCLICDVDEAQALELAITENIQRSDLSAIDEAKAFRRWLELHPDATQEELGSRIGRSQAYVSNRIRLLGAPEGVLELVEAGKVDPSWVRDELLPFANIPPKKWVALCEGVVNMVGAKRWEPSRTEFEDVVQDEACRLSRPIRASMGYGEKYKPAQDLDHRSCTCNAPKGFTGQYSSSPRCFDDDWWNAANKGASKAQKAVKKAAAKTSDKARERAVAKILASKGKRPTVQSLFQRFDRSDFQILYSSSPYDADLLPADKLAWAKDHGGVTGSLVCFDPSAAREAHAAAEAAIEQAAAEEVRARLKDVIRSARRRTLNGKLLRLLLKTGSLDGWNVEQTLRDLGYLASDFEDDAGEKYLPDITDEQLEIAIKVMAVQVERGDDRSYDERNETRSRITGEQWERILEKAPPLPVGLSDGWHEDDDTPAAEDDLEPGPDGRSPEPAGRYELRADRPGSRLLKIVDRVTGGVVASGLTTRQAKKRLEKLQKEEATMIENGTGKLQDDEPEETGTTEDNDQAAEETPAEEAPAEESSEPAEATA